MLLGAALKSKKKKKKKKKKLSFVKKKIKMSLAERKSLGEE